MDNFYKYLQDNNLGYILNTVDFEYLTFTKEHKVYSFIDAIRNQNARCFVYGDYDADGLYCVKEWMEFLDTYDITYDIYNYTNRTHDLDWNAVVQCIQGKYDYFIVSDTGSSSMDLIKMIANAGIKMIILDHHNSIYNYDDYPENVAIINTTYENNIAKDAQFKMSACCLVYYVLAKYLKLDNKTEPTNMVIYALISLYSDCMDMRNQYNRAVYYKAMAVEKDSLPNDVRIFMSEYTSFKSRFISFRLVPRINAMFRSENLQYINNLFFKKDLTVTEIDVCVQSIENIYTSAREMVAIISDAIECVELEHFVLVDLWNIDRHVKVMENKLYNYTGLIANKISERYGKTAVVYCLMDDFYKGSVRDIFGRNYRSLFKQICFAEGHDAAFGIKINYLDFFSFEDKLKRIDKHFYLSNEFNSPVIIDVGYSYPDNILIKDIAQYNEFSGQSLPIVYLRKDIVGNIRGRKTNYYYLYNWGDFTIQSDYALALGRKVLLKPIMTKDTPRLIATTDLRIV